MPSPRPTLVLTGATGFIGSHIASYFAAHDWNVIALVRNIPPITKTEKAITTSTGWSIFPVQHIYLTNVLYSKFDLASDEAVIPDDVDLFIHAAYIKNENGNDAFRLNLESTKRLLKVMSGKKVKQKLFLSSLSADANALSVYGKQKAAIEELFLKENGTVIRAGLVLGNGGLFEAMRNYFAEKRLIPLFGNGKQPLQTVYIDDLVESIYKITEKNLAGKFVVAREEAVPYKQFYSDLGKHLRKEPKFLRVPFWMGALAISMGKLLGMKMPVTKDNLLGLKQMKHISSSEDLKKIGVKLRDHKESFLKLKEISRGKIESDECSGLKN